MAWSTARGGSGRSRAGAGFGAGAGPCAGPCAGGVGPVLFVVPVHVLAVVVVLAVPAVVRHVAALVLVLVDLAVLVLPGFAFLFAFAFAAVPVPDSVLPCRRRRCRWDPAGLGLQNWVALKKKRKT